MKKIKFTSKFFFIFLTLLFFPSFLRYKIYAQDFKKLVNIRKLIDNSEYILGPGDRLFLRYFGEKEFSGEVDILNDGTISIPIIGDTNITGLTKKMAEEKIEFLLSPHLIQKDVQIIIKKTRNLKIAILGEVINPGIYSMSNEEISFTSDPKELSTNPVRIKGLPTLVDAIQKSGGITNKADIARINIKRKNPIKKDIETFSNAQLNLFKLLEEGDFAQNPFLFDGDIITISQSKDGKTQNLELFGNLSPAVMSVFVVGEVNNPGLIRVNANLPLSKVLMAAGGPKSLRANKTNIKIMRGSSQNSFSVKNYKFNLKNNLVNSKNPIINNGDVIFVGSSAIAKAGDAMTAVAKPFLGIVQILSFIKLVND